MHCPLGIVTPHSTRLLHSHVPISQFVQFCYHPVKFKIAICESSIVLLTKPIESSQRVIVESDVQTHVRRWQFCIGIRHEQSRSQISVPCQWVSICHLTTPPLSTKWVLVFFFSSTTIVSTTFIISTFATLAILLLLCIDGNLVGGQYVRGQYVLK